jgi:hypothetical protein
MISEAEQTERLAAELRVVRHLAEAWNDFAALPVEHPDDAREFRSIIHDAQARILCRHTRRRINGGGLADAFYAQTVGDAA